MEEFLAEHGGMVISGIITISLIGIIIAVIILVGNMDIYEISNITGGR